MHDFTLIIPTHNRAHLFAALLSYLEAQQADCRILVLDSSDPEVMAANRARVQTSPLNPRFFEFKDETIGEKWRQGIHRVETAYCALCADDDLVILDGVRQCLEVLRVNPAASVVQGYSFSFLPRPDNDIELHNIVYFSPSIREPTPLVRLARLFERYQAPVYGLFRTPTLQWIFETLRPLTEALSRELMWSALTVIEGHVIRVPILSYGRSMGPPGDCSHWHPLEWLCKDPDGLFAEYMRYRELMAAAVTKRPDNDQPSDQIGELIDLIHMRYLVKHAPDTALQFIAGQQMAGADFMEYWPRHEIHLPLYTAAGVEALKQKEALVPKKMQRGDRFYTVFPAFYAPTETARPSFEHVMYLTEVLDSYRPAVD